MKQVILFLAGIVIFIGSNSLSQSIPQKINYQGVLKDGSGVILANGSYNITFSFYNVVSGGTASWTESKSIDLVDGVFSTVLGSSTPIAVSFTQEYWLGVKVGTGSELTPRMALTSVPYSFMSMNVADGSITTIKLSDNSVTSAKILDGSITSADIGSNQIVKSINGIKDSVTLVAGSNVTITPSGNNLTISAAGGGGGGISGGGTANYVPLFSGTTSIGNSVIYQSSGNIGIGTLTPTKKLEVTNSDIIVHNLTIGRGPGDQIDNAVLGFEALKNNIDGNSNVAIGYQTLFSNLHSWGNIAVGRYGLFANTTGAYNIAVGDRAIEKNTSGHFNIGIGSLALYENTTGYHNVASGYAALYNNTTGSSNVAIGNSALFENTRNSNSVAVGDSALFNNGFGADFDEGIFNTAVGSKSQFSSNLGRSNSSLGYRTLYSNFSGNDNTSIGSSTLYSNTTGSGNTSVGSSSMYSNTTGLGNIAIGTSTLYNNSTGSNNTAIGGSALNGNTIGNLNVAIGTLALHRNTTISKLVAIGDSALFNNGVGAASGQAIFNTAIGSKSLFTNTIGYNNTGLGFSTLYSNLGGNSNTAIGTFALNSNTTGNNNTSVGSNALLGNSTGYSNTSIGSASLAFTTTGWQNTSFGANSLLINTTGSYNTALGFNTGPNAINLFNTTCIGIDASATGSDMVRIGNTFVQSIGGYRAWTNLSDGRFKVNVQENVPGLNFIKLLRPITYQMDREQINDITGVNERRRKIQQDDPTVEFLSGERYSELTTGFIAQEVEQAANSLGFNFSGVDKPKNENDMYGLRYAEFVVPLVKAVQEQQKIIEELTRRIEVLEAR